MAQKNKDSRFQVERSVLIWDKAWRWFITIGGVGVILAVMLICVFIFIQILPLFTGATVSEAASFDLPKGEYEILAVDEWTEKPILIRKDGVAVAVDLTEGGRTEELQIDLGLRDGEEITDVAYSQKRQRLVYGTNQGRFIPVALNYKPNYQDNKRQLIVEPKVVKVFAFDETAPGWSIVDVGYGGYDEADGNFLGAAIVEKGEERKLVAQYLKKRVGLIGAGVIKPVAEFDLSKEMQGKPKQVHVSDSADILIVTTMDGEVYYFNRKEEEIVLTQRFRPFEDKADPSISEINFILSDVSLVLTGAKGECRIFSLFIPEENSLRLWGNTQKNFERLNGPATFCVKSMRNKAFLLASGKQASLRYMTNGSIRWQQEMAYKPVIGRISGKYNSLLLLDETSKLHILKLDDNYPQAGFSTFFSKIWYEGYSTPDFTWQSTGGSDDFEPKLSMVPLIFGTLKGTLYAMLFAVPVAIIAALYASQFQHGAFRKYVKPIMEIMASLPSVVLGFIAALWLAPKLADRVPAVLLFIIFMPIAAYLFGHIWWALPPRARRWIPEGREFVLMIPMLFGCWFLAEWLGPLLESQICTVVVDGKEIADFRMWWPTLPLVGGDFEERNCLVVGFVMGFAVIPIIFTISEDAMSNVPAGLVTASTALGASRWQTAVRVVLPTASAGIFSATMMGLGRAVGETMIMVMATGNTAIMEWNVFNGMRTLSANIAVELPEAPHGETLYRSLFLGAFILFLMTFAINTLAELLRQHLREKYKTV